MRRKILILLFCFVTVTSGVITVAPTNAFAAEAPEEKHFQRALRHYLKDEVNSAIYELNKSLLINPDYEKAKELLSAIFEKQRVKEKPIPGRIMLPEESAILEYLLGPEDVVAIEVWGEDTLCGDYRVDTKGNISFPLIGEIKVAGKGVLELKEILASELKEYIIGPTVSVAVKEYKSQKVTVLGEAKPGTYALRGPSKLLEFLTSIGGFTESADTSKVIIARADGSSVTIDLNKILFKGEEKENIYLQSGDRIHIPSLKASGSEITVLGETKPGAYPLKREIRVLDFIASIGGTTKDADISRIRLTRKDGTLHLINLNRILFENDEKENLVLEPGDRIYIPSLAKSGQKILILGEVKSPGVYLVKERIRLSEAIARAGSFSEEAILSRIKVIRGNLEKPEVLSLNLAKLLKKGEKRDDIFLEPDDIVYVPKSFMGNVNYYIKQVLPTIQLIGWGHAILKD
ncbi:MAG: SLBB domain-containing protein [Candidatus Omnitrophica bacterium]|nr:SLBB domain-containing protein [Candidatus Omnitrophota bacterium]